MSNKAYQLIINICVMIYGLYEWEKSFQSRDKNKMKKNAEALRRIIPECLKGSAHKGRYVVIVAKKS